MNKIKAGIAGVVGLGVLAGLPLLTGHLAGSAVRSELERVAVDAGFRVESLVLVRSYGSTEVKGEFVGEGLRELSNEAISINGEITHGSLFSLPSMASANVDVRITQGVGGSPSVYSGEAEAQMSWFGRRQIVVDMDAAVVPVDDVTGVVVAIEEHTARYDSAETVSGTHQVHFSGLSMMVSDPGADDYRLNLQPSVVRWNGEEQAWGFSVPSVELLLAEGGQLLSSIEDVSVDGVQSVDGAGLVGAALSVSTGVITVPEELGDSLGGMSLQARVENIHVDAALKLEQAVRNEDSMGLVLAGLELLDYQPAYHLEDLTLNTGTEQCLSTFL